jgi:hypothetical protein
MMRHKRLTTLLVGTALAALCAGTTLAAPIQQRDQDQTQDQLHDQDRLQTPDQDRDRDRLHTEDQLGSLSLLTSGERNKMIERLRSAKTTEARAKVRNEYQNMIRQRATALGLDAPFGPGAGQGAGSGRGAMLMMGLLTDQERTRFYNEMRNAKTVEERNRIRSEHQKTIRERAQAMGINMPQGFGFGMGMGNGQQMMQQNQQMQKQQQMQQMPGGSMGGGMGSGMGGGMGGGARGGR